MPNVIDLSDAQALYWSDGEASVTEVAEMFVGAVRVWPGFVPQLSDDFSGRAENVMLGDDPAWTWLRSESGSGEAIQLSSANEELRVNAGPADGAWYSLDSSASLSGNQFAEVVVPSLTAGSSSFASALCRVTNASNYYEARWVVTESGSAVNEVRLIRRSGGTNTVLATESYSYSVPSTLRIEANGTSIRVLMNGSEIIAPETDSTHDSGGAGLGMRRSGGFSSTNRIDSFACGGL